MIPALSERAFYQDISFLDFQLSRTIPHESRHFVIPAVIEISLLGVLWSGGNEGSWLITIASGLRLHDQCHSAAPRTPAAGDSLDTSASKSSIRRFVITEKAPTRAFSWLNAATTAFTVDIRHYANQTARPLWLLRQGPNFTLWDRGVKARLA